MANTIFHTRSDAPTTTPAQISVPVLSATVAVFAAVSFLLCMLLGFIAPEWGLHRPWLQFYLGLTGFDLWSVVLGTVQSVVFGGYAGALLGAIFNVISRRFG
ncbi:MULTISPECIES: hypothetical protein [Rhizobium]|uniref:Uncharacterized protein n=1 Tax=Rhizobium etli TaxID=29449 RepID=A0AAN1EMM0_RHIET|nr:MULTISPECIES: hypothetical protein [Rhizobium]AGS24860.1 hypothetical protein REMIM1_PD00247 [Rhizobium etli bv. mimosae str. Mim1]ANK89303.1 hypothetical protein AMK02_PE00240 [Rhizobium sp. N731]ANK94657.1 hypothetical protein AMK01_PC00241 [Rhizobium sp. N6212]ANL00707.1 hypothetical protein AMK00_PC00241 [Rhizobium sp. N621]ANL06828.1 hypothetical protein AMJ99_PC00241 [Rhizobium esperanzae]